MSGITRDVIPFGFAFGPKAVLVGLNVVGLKRRKFSRTDLHRIRDAYQMLFFGEDTFAERLQRTGTKFPTIRWSEKSCPSSAKAASAHR